LKYINRRKAALAQRKVYREAHKKELSEKFKRWYNSNKEQQFENIARWQEIHPEEYHFIKTKARHVRRARLNNIAGSFTADEIKELAHQQENKCYYCGKLFFNGNLIFDRHIEHKTPLSRGGTNDVSNIVLSCSKCNRIKHTKTHDEFLAE